MKMTTASGAAMAAAAASLFIAASANAATDAAGARPAMGRCMTANACKGQGFAMTAKAPCKKAGHKFESM